MSTDNMRTHLNVNDRPACNNFTSSDIKLKYEIKDVDCNSCKRTIEYKRMKNEIRRLD